VCKRSHAVDSIDQPHAELDAEVRESELDMQQRQPSFEGRFDDVVQQDGIAPGICQLREIREINNTSRR
jgi:hypothetical protein